MTTFWDFQSFNPKISHLGVQQPWNWELNITHNIIFLQPLLRAYQWYVQVHDLDMICSSNLCFQWPSFLLTFFSKFSNIYNYWEITFVGHTKCNMSSLSMISSMTLRSLNSNNIETHFEHWNTPWETNSPCQGLCWGC
jgi:hypothetical protein